VDYRTVNTKPHLSHPNYVFYRGEEAWVTRAKQSDCVPLGDESRAIRFSDVMVHDGHEYKGLHYFTAVNGRVAAVDVAAGRIVESRDLLTDRWHLLAGWCRGIYVTDDFYYVGYSVFRRTRQTENIAWIKAKLTGKTPPLPTRIEKINRSTGAVVGQFTFDPTDLNAVFWIGPA
jgi:hypothetical protein